MGKQKKGVRLEHLSKIYKDPKTGKDFYAVHDANITIEPGEFVTLLGPSGCGKTTILRMIAGFESPDEGQVYLGDEAINELTPNKRDTAMVFQSYALLPHYNIFDNVAYGPKAHGVRNKAELNQLVEESLKGAALWDEVKYRLKKSALGLSGGQQQRLCIARALAVKPQVLLMDESTSALDPISTGQIEELVGELKRDYTVVMVTHNMQQAVRVSDYAAFFLLGDLVEFAPTDQLFNSPKDSRTKDYVSGRFG